MITDEELYENVLEKLDIVEKMIIDELSRTDETLALKEAIRSLYRRIQLLRHCSKF